MIMMINTGVCYHVLTQTWIIQTWIVPPMISPSSWREMDENLRSYLAIMGSMSLPDKGHKQKMLNCCGREKFVDSKSSILVKGCMTRFIKMGKSHVSEAERGRRGQVQQDYSKVLGWAMWRLMCFSQNLESTSAAGVWSCSGRQGQTGTPRPWILSEESEHFSVS